MAKLTITQAAKAVGKRRATLYEHVKKGKLSRDSEGNIDTSELLRVYGKLKEESQSDGTRRTFANENTTGRERTPSSVLTLQHENETLREKVKELTEDREERKEREKELRGIIKSQTLLLEDKRDKHPHLFSRLVEAVSYGVIAAVLLALLIWVLPQLG